MQVYKREKKYDSIYYGLVGNGLIDETVRLQAYIDSNKNNVTTLKLGYNKTYLLNSSIILDSVCLDLNGSTLKFVLDGQENCLDVRDNVIVKNGKIVNQSINPSGHGGYQTPIIIGDYANGNSYSSIVLDSLIIETNRPNGNGIFVTSDSNNIDIKNIHFSNSDYLGRGILVHWGNAENYLVETKHPFNVRIENITTGVLNNNDSDSSVVFISGAYNINVNNVYAEDISLKSGVAVVAGDFGNYYASALINPLVLKNIFIKNISIKLARQGGFRFEGYAYLDPTFKNLDAPNVSNFKAIGIGSGALQNGVLLAQGQNGILENFDIKGFLNGIVFAENVNNISIKNGSFYENESNGINIYNTTNPPNNIVVDKVNCHSNGQSGGSSAGILVDYANHTSITNCVFGLEAAETQLWGLRVGNSSVKTNIQGNHCKGVKSGGVAYSLGSSSVYGITSSFMNNSALVGITIQAGQNPCVISTKVRANLEHVECVGNSSPISGTWKTNDKVYNDNPVAGGVFGWICVSGGTPGTWKSFGSISV